tara:strand:+ start:87 stop:602 length:516 start_codon:yes stop_codon:yes gene_type:complete
MEPKLRARLRGLLRRVENIYKTAEIDRSKMGAVRIEMIMNRCLKQIEAINDIATLPSDIKRAALEYSWRVYMDLQEFEVPHERQDIAGHGKREISLEGVLRNIKSYEETTKEAPRGGFSGGTGYRSVNWDSSYWMAAAKGFKEWNEYWNEEEAKKKRPVKVYTKEELEKFQ